MSDQPRRRRRSAPPPPARRNPLPWIAVVVGVIIAGLGIGALVSAYQNRGTPPDLASAPVVTPVPQASPVPSPPPAPSASPTPTPSAKPSPSPSAAPKRAPSASPRPATPAASASPSVAAAPATSAPAATPSVPVIAAPPSARPATAPPSARPAPTVPPTVAPTIAATPVATARAELGSEPAGVVRRYVDALSAGNTAAANALLAPGGTPKEAVFLDSSASITSERVARTDAGGTWVQAEIRAARGTYVASFHVTAGGAIDQHDYIKE